MPFQRCVSQNVWAQSWCGCIDRRMQVKQTYPSFLLHTFCHPSPSHWMCDPPILPAFQDCHLEAVVRQSLSISHRHPGLACASSNASSFDTRDVVASDRHHGSHDTGANLHYGTTRGIPGQPNNEYPRHETFSSQQNVPGLFHAHNVAYPAGPIVGQGLDDENTLFMAGKDKQSATAT